MIELLCKQHCTEQKPTIQLCSSPSGKPRWALQYWSSSNANKKWMLQHLTATACCLPTSLRSDSAWPYTNKTNKQTNQTWHPIEFEVTHKTDPRKTVVHVSQNPSL
jgi:hypothetical protein